VPSPPEAIGIGQFGRYLFAAATIFCVVFGFGVRDDPRWFAASAAFGTMWWAWDLLIEHLFAPLGHWVERLLTGQEIGASRDHNRPNLDEVIRLLEGHLDRGASRQVDINSALRLEEIYRTVKKDPARARAVVEKARARYPDAPELQRFALDE
jgi:hypothetical protein